MRGNHNAHPVDFFQPCWSCKRSTPGCGCPWAERFEPVKGWDAIPCELNYYCNGKKVSSYEIHNCPEYDADSYPTLRKWLPDKEKIRYHLDHMGRVNELELVSAILERTKHDFVRSASAIQRMRVSGKVQLDEYCRLFDDCDSFFRSRWFAQLTGLDDGERIEKQLCRAYNIDYTKVRQFVDALAKRRREAGI